MGDYSPFTTGDSRLTSAGGLRPAPAAPARLSLLSHALILKSLVEVLFVAALAVHFSYTNFNTYFRGAVDAADERNVSGWVVNTAAPREQVEVPLYIDGHFVSRRVADAPRPDVLAAGRSLDPDHGFVFNLPPLPPNRTYEARVYAMHKAGVATRRVLQEFGATKEFSVTQNDVNSSVPDAWWESEGRR
ncbi:MAG TPA: hypothetical protein VEZ40_01515 [Pyrinomonadaceae bacterium]|nr:hypothetical protein [Pyrinomonadaceae bacterium]